PRPRADGRLIFRRLREEAAAARRTARIYPGSAARIPRRRGIRMGDCESPGRPDDEADGGGKRTETASGAAAGQAAIQNRREPNLPDGPLARSNRHLEDCPEVS